MSRVIKMSDEALMSLALDMVEDMKKKKKIKGEYTYTVQTPVVDRHAEVIFTQDAFIKMLSLIMSFDKEVGWYGTCTRQGDLDDDVYLINDIMVFPQKTTSTTVDSDDERRTEWFDSLPVETLVNLKADFHSHVNMAVSPSSTDEKDMEAVLENLDGEAFRIFMIWNKKLEFSCKIFDMLKNVMFDTADVRVDVEGIDLHAFVTASKAMVTQKTYIYNSPTTVVKTTTTAAKTAPVSTQPIAKAQIPPRTKSETEEVDDMEEDDWDEEILAELDEDYYRGYYYGDYDDVDDRWWTRRRRGNFPGYYGNGYY